MTSLRQSSPLTRRSNPTSEAEKDEICALRQRNWSLEDIAAKLGKSRATITYWCMVLGAEPNKAPTSTKRHLTPHLRKGKPVRPFSPEEDRHLVRLEGEGLAYSEIARRLGRDPSVCRKRLLTLGRHEDLRHGEGQ